MRKPIYLFIFASLTWLCFSTNGQTGPGGVGNTSGSGGQPRNRLWLRGDAGVYTDAGVTDATNGQTVQQWSDQSLNNCHSSQTTVSSQPTYYTNVLNGFPVLRFNGSNNEMLFGSSLDGGSVLPMGFFAVTRNTTNPRGLFDSRPNQGDVFRFFSDGGNNNSVEFWNQNPYRSGLNLSSSGSVVSVIGSLDGSSNRQLDAYITGTQVGLVTGNTSAVGFSSARLGSINQGTAGWFNGDIAEVIYYSSAVNAAQRVIVENYLGAKYGLTLAANDYFANTTYTKDLIGIGTTNGTIKHSSANAGALLLAESSTTLNAASEYLFAGHDGTTHSATGSTYLANAGVVSANVTSRWAREYRVEKTGSVDVTFGFDYAQAAMSRISNTASDYVLLYRANTTSNYSIVTLSGSPDVSVANRVSFTVLNANISSGYYTLGLKSALAAGTLYSYTANCSGGCNFETASSWTTDATGATSVGSRVPRNVDNVVVLSGNTVNVSGGFSVVMATVNTGGVLDLGTSVPAEFSTLSGAGTLKMSASSGTLVFPTVGTNNLIANTGSTVEYNGSGTYTLPSTPATYRNLTISGLGTKSSASALTVNETFTIQPPTTLNTSGDLNVNGNFVNNGQFNQSAGTTTFGSSVAQSIGGSPIATIFNHLTINNSGVGAAGTITSTIDFSIVGNFTASSNNTTAFNATSGSIILSSNSAQSIGGTGTGAVNFYTLYTSGTGIKTINRTFSVTNALITNASSNLRFPAGGTAYTLNVNDFTNNGNLNMAAVGLATNHILNISGNMVLNNASVLNLVNTTNVANLTFTKSGAQMISGATPTTVDMNNVTVNSTSVTTLSNFNLIVRGNLTVNGALDLGAQTANRASAGGTLLLAATGILKLGGTTTFPTNYSTNTLTAGSTVEYNGTTQNVAGTGLVYQNLTLGGGTKSLLANATVSANLTLNTAILSLGAFNLALPVGSAIVGTPSATNCIQAASSGYIQKYFNAAGSFTFPTGTGSVYSPLTLNITSATFGGAPGTRFVSVRNTATVAPSQLDGSWSISKYWGTIPTNISAINGSLTCTYNASEANATAEPLYGSAYYNGGSWAVGSTATVASRVISFTLTASTLTGNWTCGPNVAFIAGAFYSIANATFELGSTWSLTGYAGAATLIPPTSGSVVNIGSNKTVTATAGSKALTTVNIDPTGTLDMGTTTGNTITTLNGSGVLRITAVASGTAVFPTVTTNNFITTANSTVEYYGTVNYNLPAAPTTYRQLAITGSGSTKLILATTTVSQTLVLNSGFLALGNLNLDLGASATVSGTPSATNMVLATGTGSIRKYYDATGSFTFPFGTAGVYTPATVGFTTALFGGGAGSRYVAIRPVATVAPNQLDATYSLTRYWVVSSVNISLMTASLAFTYDLAERNATAEPIYTNAVWNGSWTLGGLGGVASPVVSFGTLAAASINGNYTAGPNVAFTAGNFYSIANGNFENGSTWSTSSYIGAATVIPPTIGSTVNIGNNKTVTATVGSKTLTTVNIDGAITPGTLDLGTTTGSTITTLSGSGTLRISASGGTAVFPTVTTNNFIGTAGNTVEYYGASNYNLPSTPATYRNLKISDAGVKTLSAAVAVNTSMILNSGLLELANFNLSLPVGSTVSGTPSASNMVTTSGTGVIRRYFNANGNFTYPVGTGSVYTPASISFTATFGGGAGTRYIDVRAVNTVAPNQLDATYSITKYWVINTVNLSNINATINATFDISERNVSAEPIYVSGYWNGSAWTTGIAGSVVSQVITFTRTAAANLNGNWTAGPPVAFTAGNFYSIASGNWETPSTWSLASYVGAATVIAPTNGSTINIGNNRTVTVTAGTKTLTTVNVSGGGTPGTLDLQNFTGIAIGTLGGSGKIRLTAGSGTAVFPTVTTNNFIGTAGNTIEYYGATNYNLPATFTTYQNLMLTGTPSTKLLLASTIVQNTLTLNSGILDLANFNLSLPVGSNYTGTPSATNMIRTSGTGVVRRYFDAIGNFTFPVGTGSVYTPAFVNLTAATFGGVAGSRYMDVRAINTVAPSQLDASYSLTKYWATSTANLSAINATLQMTYDASERNATAEPIYVSGYYNAGWAAGILGSVASQIITFSRSAVANLTGNWTAGPYGAFLPGAYYTRANGSFETAGNWSQVSYGGAASLIPPTNGSTVYVGNSNSILVTAGTKSFASLQLDAGAVLDLQTNSGLTFTTFDGAGTLRISASGGTAIFPTVTTNNFIATAGNTVEYYGLSNFNLPASPTSYRNLTLTGNSTKSLLANTTVNTVLTMNSGILDLGTFILSLPTTSSIAGSAPGSTNFIRTSSTGVVRKYFDAPGSFNFPIGTGSVYTPFNLTIGSATFGGAAGSRYLDVRAIPSIAPSQLDATYSITKYWSAAAANISNVSGSINATYDATEAYPSAAVEAIYGSGKFIGGAWTTGATSTVASRVITFPLAAAFLTGNWTAGPNVAFLPGTFYSFVTGDYETASTWSLTAYAGPVSPIPPTTGSNVSIGNNRTVTTTAGSKTVPTVTIDGLPNPGTLDVQSFTGFAFTTLNGSGNLRISATGGTAVFPTVTTNNFLNTAGNTVEYYGSANYNLPSGITTYRNLVLTGLGSTKSLLAHTTINTNLTLNSGVFSIGNFNLAFPVGSNWSGTPSASNMIRTSGTGVVRRHFDAAGSFTYPIGTGSVYTPYSLTITSAGFAGAAGSRYVNVRAVNTIAPSQLDATYSITKHWVTSVINLSNVNGSATATYDATEAYPAAAVEAIYGNGYYNGSVWTTGATSTVASRVISYTLAGSTMVGNWTAGPNVAFLPGTFYSFANGNYESASTWSLSAYAGPVSPIPPTTGSNVSIGNNRTVTTTAGSKTIPTVTIDGTPTPGTLDIQSFTGFTFTTLNGAGTLRISAPSGTAVFPTVTTNNFISNAGSTVEYYGTGSYGLPAAPLSYRNLTLTGVGSAKTLGGNTTVNENFTHNSGSLELADRNFTVTGATNNSGTITDNNDTGTNTFTGGLTNNGTGSISTANASPFAFGGNLTNNGTFNKTGNGAVTFNGGTQAVNGSTAITMAGNITLATGATVQNSNNAFLLSNISIGQNGRLVQQYSGFPTSYTASNNGLAINTGFEVLSTSNNAGNAITSTTGDNFTFSSTGSGSVYGSRTIALAPSATAQVVRFNISTASTSATSTAATMIIGSGFSNNATVHTATARLQVNLSATTGDFTLTHPDGTPTTSGTLNGTQTITWVINTTGASVTYTEPNGNGTRTLATGQADVWAGNNRFASGLAVQTAAQTMSNLKFVFNSGSGSITLDDIQVNPLGTINTSTLAQTCYQVTTYDGDSIQIPFTTPVSVTSATHFNSTNTYTAQLSNSAGSFASPTTLGTLTTSALSGTIDGFIPANLATGTGYRVRVVSNLPISIANDNGTNVTVNQFKIAPAPSQVLTTTGTGTAITATALGVTAYQWGYYTTLGGPVTDLSGKTASTYTPYGPDFPGAGTYSLVCRMTTSGCGTSYSNYVPIYINCPLTANLVTNGDFSSGNTAFTSEYIYVVDDPMSNVEMYPEQTYAVVNNPYDVHNLFCNMDLPAERSPESGGNMLVGNAATSGSLKLWTQNITVTPNTDYVLTFNAVSLAGAESSLLFGIYTGCYRTGADISVPFETYNCIWNKYSFQFNSGNNTTVPLSIVNISAQAAGNDIAIDDIVVYACASVSSPPFVVANAPYWRGISSDWFNKDNWGTTCSLPTCADDVYIPLLGSGKVYPTINAAGAAAKTVQIRTGARLTINSGYNLNICGDFDNSGTFTANGTSSVTFIGNTNPAQMMGNQTGTSKFTNVIINKTNVNDTVKMAANTEISGNFTITKGQFKAKGYNMKLGGNYSNAGTYNHNNGTLEFNTGTNATVTQTGTGSFYNVKINKSSGSNTVTFNPATTTIANQLDLTLGQVVTSGTNEISVTNTAANAVVNHSAGSYVFGRLRRSVSGANNYDFPVGDATRYEHLNMNVTSSLVGTSTVLGYFNGATAPGSAPSLTEGPKLYEYVCGNGYWTLTPNAQPSSGLFNLTITPVGLTCSGVYQTIAKRANSGAAWSFGGSTPVSPTQRNGFSSFSEIGQIGAEEPLAVHLISFEGWWNKQRIELQWKTANEKDASHFIVEKSADGIHFEAIGRVESKIRFSTANTYTFTDEKPVAGSNYYRLKSVDLVGQFDQSRPIRVEGGHFDRKLTLQPNPANSGDGVQINYLAQEPGYHQIVVVDLQGKTHFKATLATESGQNELQILKGTHLPRGMYLVYVKANDSESSEPVNPIKWVVQ